MIRSHSRMTEFASRHRLSLNRGSPPVWLTEPWGRARTRSASPLQSGSMDTRRQPHFTRIKRVTTKGAYGMLCRRRGIMAYPPFPFFSHLCTRAIVRDLSPVSSSIREYGAPCANILAVRHRSDSSLISVSVGRSRKNLRHSSTDCRCANKRSTLRLIKRM